MTDLTRDAPPSLDAFVNLKASASQSCASAMTTRWTFTTRNLINGMIEAMKRSPPQPPPGPPPPPPPPPQRRPPPPPHAPTSPTRRPPPPDPPPRRPTPPPTPPDPKPERPPPHTRHSKHPRAPNRAHPRPRRTPPPPPAPGLSIRGCRSSRPVPTWSGSTTRHHLARGRDLPDRRRDLRHRPVPAVRQRPIMTALRPTTFGRAFWYGRRRRFPRGPVSGRAAYASSSSRRGRYLTEVLS